MRTAVYLRVSTDAQERDGTSLDTQARACIEYAGAKGWNVVETVRDSASGFTLERPGLERLRNMLRDGVIKAVIVYAVDRLSRNQNHIGVLFDEIQRVGAQLDFVTEKFEDTAVGRFILAARAFIAEVEREKITERTSRGKAERARSGRIPQGTGKGCFGYIYEVKTGRRLVEPIQAATVARVFERYLATRSFSAVSNELNQAGIPSFTGGRWYPLTIRRVLTNEAYTGRLVYRRTKRVKSYSSKLGRTSSHVIEAPKNGWIEVRDACPPIIGELVWNRVRSILADPERTRRNPTRNNYFLRSRAKCGICGSAMVGQTLRVSGGNYKYYRCRHVYDRNVSHTCTAKYVPGLKLEETVWSQIENVLAHPEVVVSEYKRWCERDSNQEDVAKIGSELATLSERERRLVHLYTMGQVQEEVINEETARITQQRASLQERLGSIVPKGPAVRLPAPKDLGAVCAGVRNWLRTADSAKRSMTLEALQVSVSATKDEATVTGVLPVRQPVLLSQGNEYADVCSMVIKPEGIPFIRRVQLA